MMRGAYASLPLQYARNGTEIEFYDSVKNIYAGFSSQIENVQYREGLKMHYRAELLYEDSYIEVQNHICKGIGRLIEIGKTPQDTKWYQLQNIECGMDQLGMFVQFELLDQTSLLHFYTVKGIKSYGYQLFDDQLIYCLCVSDEPWVPNTERHDSQIYNVNPQEFRMMVGWIEFVHDSEDVKKYFCMTG